MITNFDKVGRIGQFRYTSSWSTASLHRHPTKEAIGIRALMTAATALAAVLTLAACGSTATTAASRASTSSPAPPSQAQPSAAAAPPSSGPPDPAVTVCQKFSAIYPKLSAGLNADAKDPSALSPNSTLTSYANDLLHGGLAVDRAEANGTTSATFQFAIDLGKAGLAVVPVAEPLPGVTPDVRSAIAHVNAVHRDCAALAG